MQAAADLRPLSVGEVLDVAIKIYWRNAGTLLRLVALVVAPVAVLSGFIQASALPDEFNRSFFSAPAPGETEPIQADELWVGLTAFGLVTILSFLASTVATGACFKAVADAYLGERPEWRSSLRFAFARLLSILWVTILAGILTAIGFLLLVLPGIWLLVAFSVAVPVLLTEGARGRRALARSRRLVKGRWWPAFGILLIGYLIAGVATMVLSGLVEAVAFTDAGDSSLVYVTLGTVADTAATVLTTPFTAAFVTVLYFDLRVRKEGFDLELLAERIGVARDPARRAYPPSAPTAPTHPSPASRSAEPPFWPPPPGWKPPSDETGTG